MSSRTGMLETRAVISPPPSAEIHDGRPRPDAVCHAPSMCGFFLLASRDEVMRRAIFSGETNMSHSLSNLEHHHFKYPAHRRPGDAHVYFFGADAFSFGDGVRLKNGDVMEIELAGFGRALRNPVRGDKARSKPVFVTQL